MSAVPLVLLGLVFVVGSVVLTILLLFWTRKIIAPRVSGEHNPVVGAVFAAAGTVYAVVLAFVVFLTWDHWGVADASVVAEAASLVTVYRTTQDLPQPVQKQAQEALRSFVRNLIDTEWSPSHGTLGPHLVPDNLNPVWNAFRAYTPTTAADVAAHQDALSEIYQLERQEHLVHMAREGTLPSILWLVLIVGAVITVAFSYLLAMDDPVVHAMTSGGLAALLATLLVLIFALNFPFTGTVHVSQQPLEHALLMFEEIDRS